VSDRHRLGPDCGAGVCALPWAGRSISRCRRTARQAQRGRGCRRPSSRGRRPRRGRRPALRASRRTGPEPNPSVDSPRRSNVNCSLDGTGATEDSRDHRPDAQGTHTDGTGRRNAALSDGRRSPAAGPPEGYTVAPAGRATVSDSSAPVPTAHGTTSTAGWPVSLSQRSCSEPSHSDQERLRRARRSMFTCRCGSADEFVPRDPAEDREVHLRYGPFGESPGGPRGVETNRGR